MKKRFTKKQTKREQPQPVSASDPAPEKPKPITIRSAITSEEFQRRSKFLSDSHEIEMQYLRLTGFGY